MEVMIKGLLSAMLVAAMCFATPGWTQDKTRRNQDRNLSREIATQRVDYDDARDVTPRGMFFGANIGVSRYELEQDSFDALTATMIDSLGFDIDSGTSTLDDESNAFALVAGYRLSKYLAGEASFMDFGNTDYRANVNLDTDFDLSAATLKARLRTRALGFSLLGTLPLGRGFDVHARLGRLSVQTRLDATASVADGSGATLTRTTDSNQILYGVGASSRIGERWAIDVDYQVLQTSDTLSGDVRALLLGFQFRL